MSQKMTTLKTSERKRFRCSAAVAEEKKVCFAVPEKETV